MQKVQAKMDFAHIQNQQLHSIIRAALRDMAAFLDKTPCLTSSGLADQLNQIKKDAFKQMYEIGHETDDLNTSEDVLKSIRALQDVFAQIIIAVSAMDDLNYMFKEIWLKETDGD